jgi:L-ascorbate metabolism protein UlaG (beta-lactamase superfamily)
MSLAVAAIVVPASIIAQTSGQTGATLEWLGWNAWRLTSPSGKVVLTNPFVTNPDSPVGVDDIEQADLILVTNGHGDEVGQSIDIAANTGARIVPGAFELGTWFIEMGVPEGQVHRTGGPGNRVVDSGITVRIVSGAHGSGVRPNTQTVFYGGVAGAFVVTLENGWTLFYGGSSAATYDHSLVAQMYRPNAAILHMGGSAEPMDFAMQVKLLKTDNPNLTAVFPGHHRYVQEPPQTTIAQVQAAIDSMALGLRVTAPQPGQVHAMAR